ncbi:MAG TPA: hypothetical protein VGH87_03425 [Polyangiaceae bacterium]|jgi:hypothetical protein
MKPSEEEVRDFVTRFGHVAFPHAAQVLSFLAGKHAEVTIELSTGANFKELRSTYRVRATFLATKPLGPTFPRSLPGEVSALADALEAADEQPTRIWRFALPSGKVFIVFELVDARQIAGVVESADQRIVAPSNNPPGT